MKCLEFDVLIFHVNLIEMLKNSVKFIADNLNPFVKFFKNLIHEIYDNFS